MSAPTRRRAVLGSVVTLLLFPLTIAAFDAAVYHVRYRDTNTTISAGVRRGYVLHVPPSYDGATPTALVISLHGAGGWGAAQRETSQWDRVADAEGFIVAYPSAVSGSGPRIWHEGDDGGKDIAFIAELIDTLEADYAIDPDRVYVNGLSNGGGMSFALSCTLYDRIAAVGLVAAAELEPWSWCRDQRPMPVITVHGTADSLVPYLGGTTWIYRGVFPNVPKWVARWAERNGCSPVPVDSAIAADVMRRRYAGCVHGADVELYTIEGGGHTWPGGTPLPQWFVGRTATSIDASRVMWEFFRAHPKTPTRGAPPR